VRGPPDPLLTPCSPPRCAPQNSLYAGPLVDRRRFVNPGSVGMPYGGTSTFRTAASGYPGRDEFVAEIVLTVPSDAEALAVFTPR
jgi:hypothetical protein